MVRDPGKILAFKRLTQVGAVQQFALAARVRKRVLSLRKQIRKEKPSPFARAFMYVALASCLEADIKYKCRLIVDLIGHDIEVFRKLYGENKIDVDLLFHVIGESITLSDLVAEVASVSDLKSLINRSEIILNTLSGGKNTLNYYFSEAAKNDEKAELLQTIIKSLPEIMREIDFVFQVRHAVVHDVFISQAPIQSAIRPKRLLRVIDNCVAFLLLSDKAYYYYFNNGPLNPEANQEERQKRQALALGDAFEEIGRLKKRYPSAAADFEKLENWFEELLAVLATTLQNVYGAKKEDGLNMSPYFVETYFNLWQKLARALSLECSATKAHAFPTSDELKIERVRK